MSFLSHEQWEDYGRLKDIERAKELQEENEIRAMEMLLGEARWYPTLKEFRKFKDIGQGLTGVDRWDRLGNPIDWNAK